MTMARDRNYSKLLNSSRWRKLRAEVLADHPFCADCALQSRAVFASEVHHIIPIESAKGSGEQARLAYSRSNLVGLCTACHKERHRRLGSATKEEKRRRDRDLIRAYELKWFGEETPGGDFLKPGGGR